MFCQPEGTYIHIIYFRSCDRILLPHFVKIKLICLAVSCHMCKVLASILICCCVIYIIIYLLLYRSSCCYGKKIDTYCDSLVYLPLLFKIKTAMIVFMLFLLCIVNILLIFFNFFLFKTFI